MPDIKLKKYTQGFVVANVDAPSYLKECLNHMLIAEGLASSSVKTYYRQLFHFFRWLIFTRYDVKDEIELQEIKIADMPFEYIENLTKNDIYEYFTYITMQENNTSSTVRLKFAAIRHFINYHVNISGKLKNDVTSQIKAPKKRKLPPKYLTQEESIRLLRAVSGRTPKRDYLILTLFLNCGMRLSELASVNIQDVRGSEIQIIGKGYKGRTVYLNNACVFALTDYLKEREYYNNPDPYALIISSTTGKRLGVRWIEKIVQKLLQKADLGDRGFSAHTLRHTTATLMYKEGVDILTIKEILGHSSVATTEIYTHVSQNELQAAVAKSPLAELVFEEDLLSESE